MQFANYILMTTILGLGAVTGLVTLRNNVVQEYGDASLALENLNQSYEYEIIVDGNVIASASYQDTVGSLAPMFDVVNNAPSMNPSPGLVDPTLLDPAGDAPAGITFYAPSAEGTPIVIVPGPIGTQPIAEGTPFP